MRTRKAIENEIHKVGPGVYKEAPVDTEILLDIRELLEKLVARN